MKALKFTALAGLAFLSACKMPDRGLDYRVSRDTLHYLKELNGAQPVSVGAFTSRDPGPSPEWIPLKCPWERVGAKTINYPEFLRSALVQELSVAGLFTPRADAVRLSGEIVQFDVGLKMPYAASLRLAVRFSSSNGRTLTIARDHRFDTGDLAGATGCNRIYRAYPVAVQDLLQVLVTHPQLPALIGASTAG